MKKLFSVLLCVMIAAGIFSVVSSAEKERTEKDPTVSCDKINYGTPKVDGFLDDIYLTSFCSRTSTVAAHSSNGGNSEEISKARATTYILWDENWFYFFTEVYDNTPANQGEDWIYNGRQREDELWFNDGISYDISWKGSEGSAADRQRWGCDSEGYKMYTTIPNEFYVGYENAYVETYMDRSKKTYHIEMAIPNVNKLGAGDSIGFIEQLNDLVDYRGGYCIANYARVVCYFGGENDPWEYTYELVDNGKNPHPAEPVTEPATTEPSEPMTEPATQPETEPATEPVTEIPTEVPTLPATEPKTEPLTEPSTEKPTEPATEKPTEPVTEPETEVPTEPVIAPTETATEIPTPAPTQPVIEAPTSTPTRPGTEPSTKVPSEPSTAPVSSGNGGLALGIVVGIAAATVVTVIFVALLRKKK